MMSSRKFPSARDINGRLCGIAGLTAVDFEYTETLGRSLLSSHCVAVDRTLGAPSGILVVWFLVYSMISFVIQLIFTLINIQLACLYRSELACLISVPLSMPLFLLTDLLHSTTSIVGGVCLVFLRYDRAP